MRRSLLTAAAGLALAGALAGGKGAEPSLRAAAPVGSGALRLLIEPAAGVGAIDTLITGARSSVDLTMYELRDTTTSGDLAADAARGVDVRVILDRHLEKTPIPRRTPRASRRVAVD